MAAAALPADVSSQLEGFSVALRRLTNSLAAFTTSSLALETSSTQAASSQGMSHQDLLALDPLLRAQALLGLAEAANACLHLHVRCHGKDPVEEERIRAEHERLKQYRRKVNKVTAADELSRARPKATLDIAGANRFINAAIPDLTPEQRRRLAGATAHYTSGAGSSEASHAPASGAAGQGMKPARRKSAVAAAVAAASASVSEAHLSGGSRLDGDLGSIGATAAGGAVVGVGQAPQWKRHGGGEKKHAKRPKSAAEAAAEFLSMVAAAEAVPATIDAAAMGSADAAESE